MYTRHALLRSFVMTPGVVDFREEFNCFWLIDVMASRQATPGVKEGRRKDERFNGMQIWRLRKALPGEQCPDAEGNIIEPVAVVEACTDINRSGVGINVWDQQGLTFVDWNFETHDEAKFYVAPSAIGESEDNLEPVIVCMLPDEY